ncbi:MAG: glycosyltransferase family 4 protein [Nitrospirae bacterium]|nr:glycosyltransferase family 4 protein [Nitrospirota bacterium]
MNLILFFTYGGSLRTWADAGLLDREIILYKKLIENGLKVAFVTYGDESDYQYRDKLGDIEIIPSYTFVKKPSSKIIRFVQSFFLPFILKEQLKKADIFKTNQMSMTWAPLLAKLLFKKKLIVRCGFEWYRFLLKSSPSFLLKNYVYLTEWLSYKIADGIILTSEDDKKYIIDKFHLKGSKKIRIISNYIDVDFFKPSSTAQKKKNHFIFIGRLTRQKNLINLFNAIKGSKYILDIIGDGEIKEELKDYSLKNQIKVNFRGRVPNNKIPEILNQYEVFILPSYYEGNPKALLEAMSCGLAVIGTDVDGIRNIIKHKENGYLSKTDSKSIRDAIDVVMGDEFLRKNMGARARKFVISHCSIDEIVKRELEFYSTVLKF